MSGPGGAQATAEPFTRTVFYTRLTYDWETNTVTQATSPAGFYGLQFLSTLAPTLIVEGLLLWAFGFRSRRDWLVFLLVNLVTQAGLHLWIAGDLIAAGSHPLYYLVLLVAEIPILLVELAAYVFLLREHTPAPTGAVRPVRQRGQLCRGLSAPPPGSGMAGAFDCGTYIRKEAAQTRRLLMFLRPGRTGPTQGRRPPGWPGLPAPRAPTPPRY